MIHFKVRRACCLFQKLHPIRDGLVNVLLPQLNVTLQCLKAKHNIVVSGSDKKLSL